MYGRPSLWLAETFSISPLKLLNYIQLNSTKLVRKQESNLLYQVVFFPAYQKTKMAALASDWLRLFRLLLRNCWMEFNKNLKGSKVLMSSTKFVFFRADRKTKMAVPGLSLAKTFLTSLKPLNRIQWNFTGSKISMSSTNIVLLGANQKTKLAAMAFWLAETFPTSETIELKSTKFDRSQFSRSSTKLVFLGWLRDKNGGPFWSVNKGGTLNSGARYVAL